MNRGLFEKLPQSDDPTIKWCSSHNAFTLRSNFSKDITKNDGLCYGCKGCRKKVSAGYNKAYRDRKANGVQLESKHGMSGTHEHKSWLALKSKSKSKRRPVCREWRESFMAFYLWVGPRPSLKHVLRRTDLSKGFEPGNAKWVSSTRKPSKKERIRKMGLLTAREASIETGVKEKIILSMVRDKEIPAKKLCDRWHVKIAHLNVIEEIAVLRRARRGSGREQRKHVSSDLSKLWCSHCQDYVYKSKFYKDKYHWSGYSYICRYCERKVQDAYRKKYKKIHGVNFVAHSHGRSGSPEYVAWAGMKARTTNPKIGCWEYYGGRGITMCQEWKDDFLAFYYHVGPKPSPGHSIDRIDPDGNYEPGNVRWATMAEQSKNKRPYSKRPPGKHDPHLPHKKPLTTFLQEWRELHTGPFV